MREHTPGPWHYQERSDAYTNIVRAGDRFLCQFGQDTSGEAEANARLTTAAPNLLEACFAAIKYDKAIHACANNPDKMSSYCTVEGDDLDALYMDWITKAIAAIAKAGERT